MMETNLVGEMTVLNIKGSVSQNKNISNLYDQEDEEHDLILAVAEKLKVQTSEEMEGIRDVLFPSILCAAVHTGQAGRLEALKTKYGADLAAADYDARTPLHVAASEGNVNVTEYLMKSGAGVHLKDRNNDTPLLCAIKGCHRDVVRSLIACGAHLPMGSLELGEELCYLARVGQKKKLSCFKLAGADMNSVNLSRQTALHAAVETGQLKVVQFLLEAKVDAGRKDIYGHTPTDVAQLLNRKDVADMLAKYFESRDRVKQNWALAKKASSQDLHE